MHSQPKPDLCDERIEALLMARKAFMGFRNLFNNVGHDSSVAFAQRQMDEAFDATVAAILKLPNETLCCLEGDDNA